MKTHLHQYKCVVKDINHHFISVLTRNSYMGRATFTQYMTDQLKTGRLGKYAHHIEIQLTAKKPLVDPVPDFLRFQAQ